MRNPLDQPGENLLDQPMYRTDRWEGVKIDGERDFIMINVRLELTLQMARGMTMIVLLSRGAVHSVGWFGH